jgi:hypothetical protein
VIKWPERALRSMPAFFQEWNDLDVYIEDKRKITQNIYVELINRVGNGKFKIDRVFPLGGRKEVIEKCASDAGSSNRARLYLIDGDLGLTDGVVGPTLPQLFEHRVYCVENYLIDDTAVVEFLFEEFGDKTRAEIRSEVVFSAFEEEVHCLVDLFAMYATLRKFEPTKPSVSLGLSGLIKYDPHPHLNREAVEMRICNIYSELIRDHSQEAVFEYYLSALLRCDALPVGINVISGKDYLLTLLRHFVGRFGKIRCTSESFEIRLARNCSIERHGDFVDAINEAIGVNSLTS